MQYIPALFAALVISTACAQTTHRLSQEDALGIASRTAVDRGVTLSAYELPADNIQLSEDGKEWTFIYKCKDKSASPGCHLLVVVDRDSGAAEISASADEPPTKQYSPRIRAILASSTKQECETRHGTWFKEGLFAHEYCDIETSDAGKKCTDNAQCEYMCVTAMNMPDGATAVGACSKWHGTGRQPQVVSGRVKTITCVR